MVKGAGPKKTEKIPGDDEKKDQTPPRKQGKKKGRPKGI